jgi:signal transduction histidine kinase
MDVDDLRRIFIFEGLDDDQLSALLAVGEEVRFEAGEILFYEGEPATSWWVLVEGRIDAVRRAGREDAVVLMSMDRPGQWAGGFRAWDDESNYLATARPATAGRIFRIPSEELGRLARQWFPFSVHLITGFFQTVRRMDTMSRQREALIALGELAARLAHEINNPASAAARAVDALGESNDAMASSLASLARSSVTAEQFIELEALRHRLVAAPAGSDPLQLADREEALQEWLDGHGVKDGWQLAPQLVAVGATVEWCEQVRDALGGDAIGPGLEWVAAALSAQGLLVEMKESTTRISLLLAAVKSYTQVDRATLQLVDVTEGLESTLVVLGHKLGPGVTVTREFAAADERIEASPGELNQVWTNLIDNALDAMDGDGTLRLATRVDGDELVVEVADTGPGIPPEVQARMFEPFYTTKEVGKGTGLGLDISRRIVVDRHQGRITLDSRPGATVFAVHLPRPRDAADADGTSGGSVR